MEIIIETDRFFLRRFTEMDASNIFDLDSNPKVLQYIGTEALTELSQAEKVVEKVLIQYEKYSIGRLAIIDKSSKDFIGWAGIKFETLAIHEEKGYYDLGYRIKEDYWGKGIATETAKASLKYGLNKSKIKRICAAADVANIASNKVLRKIGMNLIEQFEFEGISCNWYSTQKK